MLAESRRRNIEIAAQQDYVIATGCKHQKFVAKTRLFSPHSHLPELCRCCRRRHTSASLRRRDWARSREMKLECERVWSPDVRALTRRETYSAALLHFVCHAKAGEVARSKNLVAHTPVRSSHNSRGNWLEARATRATTTRARYVISRSALKAREKEALKLCLACKLDVCAFEDKLEIQRVAEM